MTTTWSLRNSTAHDEIWHENVLRRPQNDGGNVECPESAMA